MNKIYLLYSFFIILIFLFLISPRANSEYIDRDLGTAKEKKGFLQTTEKQQKLLIWKLSESDHGFSSSLIRSELCTVMGVQLRLPQLLTH